jgi:predicted ArsR family transcriptional regulator
VTESELKAFYLGTLVGTTYADTYLLFYHGWSGTTAELAETLGMTPKTASTHIINLRDRKMLRISDWRTVHSPVYSLANGEDDAAKPLKPTIQKIVANYEKRVERVLDNIARLTKHGAEEVKGNVRVHRMRG